MDFGYLFANCLQRPAFRSTDKGEPKPAGRTHSREAISLAVSEITYRSGHSLTQLQGSPRIPPKGSPGLAIARRLGLKAVFVDTHWETILQEMQGRRYDCIVGGITVTPERERILAWSVPYFTTTLSLVVNGAKTPAIRSLTDLRHASVGVQAATTDYDAAVAMQQRGELGSIKVYPFDQIEQAMKDLEAGRITAVMKVAPVAAWLRAKALIYASWRKSQTTRGHSESGSGKISRGCWLP